MDSFDELMTDQISIVKPSGERLEKVKASVAREFVTTFDARLFDGSFALEEGDIILRPIPNGLIERFLVEDTGFLPGFENDVPPHYSMKVEKETSIKRETASSVQNIFNLGDNSRVNFHSTDNSTNFSHDSSVFAQITRAVESQVSDEQLKTALLSKVNELEGCQGTPNFTVKFQEFIALAANTMTIIGPFLPQLSMFLSK